MKNGKNEQYKNREWLIEQHWNFGLSLREMEKKAGLGGVNTHGASIVYWMKKHNIKRRKNPKAKRKGVRYELLDDVNWLTMQYWGFDLNSVEMGRIIGVQGSKITTNMRKYDIPLKKDLQMFYHYPEWLVEQHYDKKLSMEKMATIVDCSSLTMCNLMRSYGFPITQQIEYTERDERGRRWCSSCNRWLDVNFFHKNIKETDGLHAKCKRCRMKSGLEQRETDRIIALQIYSKGYMNCEICDCDDVDVLTIDHRGGGGYKHIKNNNIRGQFYRWLKRNNYPKGFRVLCWNCQHINRFKEKYVWDDIKDRYAEKRIIAIQIYSEGNMKCSLCGNSNIDCLSIDHIGGGGKKHRMQIKILIDSWLEKNDYPAGFRVLCHNCNHKECLNHSNGSGLCKNLRGGTTGLRKRRN